MDTAQTVYWIKELGLLPEHREDIVLGEALSGDVINASQRLLAQQFPTVNGLQTSYFNAHRSFRRSNGVQIHYNSEYHWVTSSTIGAPKKCCARVFDSKWNGRLSSQLEVQLAGGEREKSGTLHVEISPVHQQYGVVDCGVFAIAFATDLCHELDPVAAAYDQRKMREHLIACLERMTFQPFPQVKTNVRISARVFKTIKVYCTCRLPEKFDSQMVECERCFEWFHYCCVGISNSNSKQTSHWLCTLCQPKRLKK